MPPTGRIGRTTTGHRSGSYNLRVIPDVDANVERSEKQKVENSKFGKLSYMFNSIYEYVKLGFPRAYQPLNTAIKLNLPFVEKVDNQIAFDYSKLIFSKGDLEGLTLIRTVLRRITGKYIISVDYQNNGVGQYSINAESNVIIIIPELNIIKANKSVPRSYGTQGERRISSFFIDEYKYHTAYVYLFFSQNRQSSPTLFCGSIYLDW